MVPSRSRGLYTYGLGTYEGDKPPVFTLVNRETENWDVVPAKSPNESTVRLLLAAREKKPLTVCMDGFRAYVPLDDDERFHCEAVIHANNEYIDGEVRMNTCESHGSLVRPWLSSAALNH